MENQQSTSWNPDLVLGVIVGAGGMLGGIYLVNRWKSSKTPLTPETTAQTMVVSNSVNTSFYMSPDPLNEVGSSPIVQGSTSPDVEEANTSPEDNAKESDMLLNILFSIGESQMKRDYIIHRGISCNLCNSNPLTGVRFKCLNCVDYDVCARCEPISHHDITHVFVKIVIPIPPLANPRTTLLPSFYPGKKSGIKDISWPEVLELREKTHFHSACIEVLHNQFKSLCVSKEGITKDVFLTCLGPLASKHNLVVEQLFNFYDNDKDGIINFTDFINGMSIMTRGSKADRIRYVFQGYDLDHDGYMTKDDIHDMLKAYHQLSMELVRDVVRSCEEEMMATYDDSGNRPISAVFNAPIPDNSNIHPGSSLSKMKSDSLDVPHSQTDTFVGSQKLNDRSSAVEAMTQDAIVELVDQIMLNADLNKDGKISEEEFFQYVITDTSLLAWFESIDTVF